MSPPHKAPLHPVPGWLGIVLQVRPAINGIALVEENLSVYISEMVTTLKSKKFHLKN